MDKKEMTVPVYLPAVYHSRWRVKSHRSTGLHYSGKGAAGLIDLIRKGHFKKDERVVFIHTGSSAALFGYTQFFTAENER